MKKTYNIKINKGTQVWMYDSVKVSYNVILLADVYIEKAKVRINTVTNNIYDFNYKIGDTCYSVVNTPNNVTIIL